MPRYHFNVTDGQTVATDHEGSELPDVGAVATEARESIRHMLAEGAAVGLARRLWTLTVTDEVGQLVLSMPFDDALTHQTLPKLTRSEA